MFLEKDTNIKNRGGWIEVICGSMFSGKTEELIRRLNRARIARQKVEIFKPHIDKRYSEEDVVSHNANAIRSIPVESASQILFYANEFDVIGIDEAQFFDSELTSVCTQLANQGVRVIVAGLDMDFLGNPFGPMPQLLSIAEYVTKVHAICMQCGNLAHVSHRIVDGEKLVLLGETDSYEPLCRVCFNKARAALAAKAKL
ncbi:MAG: thymidine kinase [Bacteroidetes bacterium]|jgi:thymidine kinase|nr:MAG: thymidine kinase [Bacteroidota bacterium]